MKNNYGRLKIIALIIFIIGLYVFTIQSALAKTGLPSKIIQISQIEVTGTVTDANGIPLPGVTIAVKGENRGTITDLDGNYELQVRPQDTLIFSHIGFETLEEPVAGRSEINIWLEEDISALGTVEINAGYYTTTRRESTGNIARVTAEEIEMQPVVSPLLALQGRMAGVQIIPRGNLPGMAPTVRIRGRNSLREEGNFPLYIIDGVPVNSIPFDSNSELQGVGIDPLNTLNVSNIKSIEVLKDADATAIYGSRGANGVILITTKKGRTGRTELIARVYRGASWVPNRVDLLNTDEYLQIRRRAFENDGIEPTESNAYDLVVWDRNRYTDWQDLFFGGISPVTNINLSLTGGNDNTTFRLNGSYHTQGTVYLGEYDYRKVTAGAHLSHTSRNKKFNLDLTANYGVDHNELVGYMNLSESAFRLPPNAPKLFNDDGTINWDEWSLVGETNPLQGYYNSSLTRGHNLISSLVLSYELISGLHLKSNFGYTIFNGDEVVKRPPRSYDPSSFLASFFNRSNHLFLKRNSWIVEPQITYSTKIGRSSFDAILGGTFQQSKSSNLSLMGDGYVSESQMSNLAAAEKVTSLSHQNSDYRYIGIFVRFGYNWNQKYYINITGRRDGSSRFGPGKRLANFGAIGGAWIFSEEDFIKNSLSFLSFGKLRGSYGTTGSDQIGDYGYFDAYEATYGPGGLYPTALANPDYSWEVNKKLEAAVELGFLEDRINFGLSWYRNRSSNQLVGYSLPAVTGFSSVQANLPATVQNTGLELELSSLNIRSENFFWQTSFNITFPKNKLVSYPNIEESSYANTYKVGQPLNISLLYAYGGINPETGYYQVVDFNEDGRFDYEDRTVVWYRGREFYGGINNNLSYKNFSLQFLWQFVKQEGMLALFKAGALENQRSEVTQALEGNSRFQRISASVEASRAYSNVLNSTFPIVDASFLRLKTLNLSYTISESILKNIGIQAGKLFITGHNLLTFTPYQGMDPETPGRGSSFAGLRTISGGFQLNF